MNQARPGQQKCTDEDVGIEGEKALEVFGEPGRHPCGPQPAAFVQDPEDGRRHRQGPDEFGNRGAERDALYPHVEADHEQDIEHAVEDHGRDDRDAHQAGTPLTREPARCGGGRHGKGRGKEPDREIVAHGGNRLGADRIIGHQVFGERRDGHTEDQDQEAEPGAQHRSLNERRAKTALVSLAMGLGDLPGGAHPQEGERPVEKRDHRTGEGDPGNVGGACGAREDGRVDNTQQGGDHRRKARGPGHLEGRGEGGGFHGGLRLA